MTTKPAEFFWYDVMTPDVPGATKFYTEVVGWTAADAGVPGEPYTVLSAAGDGVAGIMTIPEGAPFPPMWTGYLYVDDVDATARRAAQLGGSVCKAPADIPTIGRFAVLADPHGAMFNVMKPESNESRPKVDSAAPGRIGWHDLSAGDLATAWTFYEKLFGWTKSDALDMGGGAVYQMFKTGGENAVGGMMTKRATTPMARWTFYFSTEAIDAAAARVTGAGGKILAGPHPVPGGQWIVDCADLQGAPFGLVAARR
jgi:uncharacterized protein